MTAVAEQIGTWVTAFAQQQPAAAWLQQLREAAFARFAELGFPTTHDEEWRFTNVAPIARTSFRPVSEAFGHSVSGPGTIRLTFINGRLVERPQNLPKGVQVGALLDDEEIVSKHLAQYASYDRHAFVALNGRSAP